MSLYPQNSFIQLWFPSLRWTMFHKSTEQNLHIVTLSDWIWHYLIHSILSHPQCRLIAFYLTLPSVEYLSSQQDQIQRQDRIRAQSLLVCVNFTLQWTCVDRMSFSACHWLGNSSEMKAGGNWRLCNLMYGYYASIYKAIHNCPSQHVWHVSIVLG